MALHSNFCDMNHSDEKSLVSVKVLLFAGARELSGMSEGELTNVPVICTHRQLLELVVTTFHLQKMAHCIALALNQNYISKGDTVALKEGDELAVIPPLSGG